MGRLIKAATMSVELDTNTYIGPYTIEMRLDCFPTERYIEVMTGQLATVITLDYLDGDGNPQTIDPAAYDVDADRIPGIVALTAGGSWPATQSGRINAVTLEYTTRDTVNEVQKQAILYLLDQFFVNKDMVTLGQSVNVVDATYNRLIAQLKPGDWLHGNG